MHSSKILVSFTSFFWTEVLKQDLWKRRRFGFDGLMLNFMVFVELYGVSFLSLGVLNDFRPRSMFC